MSKDEKNMKKGTEGSEWKNINETKKKVNMTSKTGLFTSGCAFKTRDLVPPLTKAQRTFITAILIDFQIANQKTRRRSKSLKGSHMMRGGKNSLKISAPLPLIKPFE